MDKKINVEELKKSLHEIFAEKDFCLIKFRSDLFKIHFEVCEDNDPKDILNDVYFIKKLLELVAYAKTKK